MPDFAVGDELEVEIESLSFPKGNGVARKSGFVFFVPYSAPKDKLLITITNLKKNFAEAKIKKILQPSSQRTEPQCKHYGQCGGCSLQHISYQDQAINKQIALESSLSRALKIDLKLSSFSSSPEPWRYRTRLQVNVHNQKVGFYQAGTHKLVPIEDCLLADEKLIPFFKSLRTKENKKIDIFLDENNKPHFLENKKDLSQAHFQQAHQELNKKLVQQVVENALRGLESETKIYDLYCGSGNYSLAITEKSPHSQITAVDISSRLIEKAHFTQKSNTIEFIQADIEKFLLTNAINPRDRIIINPPRTGASKLALEKINSSGVKTLIYVSCNPATLARDLRLLTNFSLEQVHAFDMFPQTMHIETLVVLKQ